MHMATQIKVNIGSCNGLSPDGTKPLLDSMLTKGIHGILLWAIP